MIVSFTDFGLEGPYAGQVAAVLHEAAPGIPVVSLFADAPAGQPKPAAYLLAAYAAWFAPGAVFLGVVDPGVGSDRQAVVVEADGRSFVGPDNGLFEIVRRRAQHAQCWQITWAPPLLSASFHGRDLFAPVAARLARGEPVVSLARAIDVAPRADWPDDLPEIVYIDHYGNAVTGLRGEIVEPRSLLVAGGHRLANARTFSAVARGAAFWYVNSNGLAEIAVNGGRADHALALGLGTPVAVTR